MTIDLTGVVAFFLVMLRMTGMLVFNPIFGRRNVPVMLNAAFAFILTYTLTASMSFPVLPNPTLFSMVYMAIKELAVGMLAGFVLQLFLSVLIVSGEVIDMQLGIGMSKIFDPASNSSISLSSTILNIMFVMLFFLTNNHLTFIYLTAQTFEIIPLGVATINPNVFYHIAELFSIIIVFSMKLCLPIAVVEVVVTFAVGMITRIIPQINIFVVNIQFKLLIGMLVMVMLVPSFTSFMENLLIICFDNIQLVWTSFT